MAVFTLPPEMIQFYKTNINYISEHAVDADKRRYVDKNEAVKHYIDIDRYVLDEEKLFDVLPKKWKDAVEKYSEDTLKTYGIVPWHVNLMVINLTKAFEEKNVAAILRCSADLGHYVADSHVPLHTTENYNGQMTNQYGIHGFWESRLPELKSKDYNFITGRAVYVDSVLDDEWNSIKESFSAKDSVLSIERELNATFSKDKKYTYENRGKKLVKVYSEEYATAYHERLNGMVERRMVQAILKTGSYWYTAWVNAGQPNLEKLFNENSTINLENEKLENAYKKNQIKGREHVH
ncbi:MAG: S1/P1 Nuclease [Vicingus serpentipes]|nr:S1/P1 Nuclease [Vicingus serpentipes]